jgi:hypothetical protein
MDHEHLPGNVTAANLSGPELCSESSTSVPSLTLGTVVYPDPIGRRFDGFPEFHPDGAFRAITGFNFREFGIE